MRKAFITLAAVLLVFLAASCDQDSDDNTATMRIIIETTTRTTIKPEDYDLDVARYHITGTGPDNASFEVTTTRSAVSLDGIVTGSWSIYGEGLNEDGDVLVTGSTVFYLSASSTSTTLTLDELVGEGTLSLAFSWDPDDLTSTDVDLVLTLTDQSDSTVYSLTPTVKATSGTASYSGTWDSGSYVLSAKLYCNDVKIAGIVEAVRIADGQTSSGTIEFDLDGTLDEAGTVSVANSTGTPVELSITGLDDTVTANSSLTVYLSAEDDNISDFEISWYLDGDFLDDGETVTFSPLIGTHTLSAVASSALIGSTGSASLSFEAIAEGEEGTPVQSVVLDTSTGVNLGADCFIKFLSDGRLMIVSNASKTVQVVSLVRSSFSIDQEFTFSEIGLSGTVSAFDAASINDSLTKVSFALEDSFNLMVYNFAMNSDSFSLVDETDSVVLENTFSDTGFTSGSADECLFTWITTGNGEVSYFLTGEDGQFANVAHYRYANGSTLFSSADTDGFYVLENLFSEGNSPVLCIGNEYSLTAVNLAGDIGGRSEWMDSYLDGLFRQATYYSGSSGINTADFVPYGLCFLSDYTMLFQSDTVDAVLSYKSTTSGIATSTWTPDSNQKAGLISNADYSYAYYIDLSENELVTLEIGSSGSSVEEIDRLKLQTKAPDTIAVSGSGANLILYNGSDVTSVELVRIATD